MSTWIAICLIGDIPVLGARRVNRPVGDAVALFRNGNDQVFALLDACPHKGGPLSQGIVLGQTVACPLHNWQICLADGLAQAPDEGSTPSFAVRLEQRQVLMDADELASKALESATGGCSGRCKSAVTA